MTLRWTYPLVACLFVVAGCAAPQSESAPIAIETPASAELLQVVGDEDLAPEAQEDLETLRADLLSLVESTGYAGELPLVLEYVGRATVTDEPEPMTSPPLQETSEPELADDPDYSSWDVVRIETGTELRVRYPRDFLAMAERQAFDRGLHLGSEDADAPLGEELEEPVTQVLPEEREPGELQPIGISNNTDTRRLRGTLDVAQTHRAFRKIVHLSNGCTGTLVGPKHIITAAHCLRDEENAAWRTGTARAGRSGNAWRASASFNTSNAWYWTPSRFRQLTDGLEDMPYSATPWDIGMVITHSNRLGNAVGWMGWYRWNSDSAFGNNIRYNRGYPSCSASNTNRPANCESFALYGDSRYCATGNYDSRDADGVNRRFRHHCDTSPGHSGSSLYTYLGGSTLAVTSVHSWATCVSCSSSRPNVGVRITPEYSGTMSTLLSMFP